MNNWDGWSKSEMSPVWDYKTNPILKGLLISKEEKVGPNESMMYTIQTDTGNVAVWGNTILDSRFKNITVGEEVGIEFLGETVSPKTKRTYKNFEVYHREIPMTKVTEEQTFID